MSQLIYQVIPFILIPTGFLLAGNLIAVFYVPSERLTIITQHFAAGVVFAAVAKELVPKIGTMHGLISLLVGFSGGIVFMLIAKIISQKLEDQSKNLALGLITATIIDLFIDGLLIGIAFLSGEKGGVLITIALTMEIIFLGMAIITDLINNKINKIYCIIMALTLALVVPLGAIFGLTIFAKVSANIMNGVIAFGVAALLYLVTEELLVTAHKGEEKIWMPIFFFIGFLLILLLEPV